MASGPSGPFDFLSVPALKSLICFFTSEQFLYSKNFRGCVLEKNPSLHLLKAMRPTLFKGGYCSGVFVVGAEREAINSNKVKWGFIPKEPGEGETPNLCLKMSLFPLVPS